MKIVTMLEFRKDAAQVLNWLQQGKETVRLTYRGKPVADLLPITEQDVDRPPGNDPFYRLPQRAVDGVGLTNQQMDALIYGQP